MCYPFLIPRIDCLKVELAVIRFVYESNLTVDRHESLTDYVDTENLLTINNIWTKRYDAVRWRFILLKNVMMINPLSNISQVIDIIKLVVSQLCYHNGVRGGILIFGSSPTIVPNITYEVLRIIYVRYLIFKTWMIKAKNDRRLKQYIEINIIKTNNIKDLLKTC